MTLSVCIVAVGSANNPEWPNAITRALKERDKFVPQLKSILQNANIENMKSIIPFLEQLPSTFDNLHFVNFSVVKDDKDASVIEFFRSIPEKSLVHDLYPFAPFKAEYETTGLGYILSQFKHKYDRRCLFNIISSTVPAKSEVKPPIDEICAPHKKKTRENHASIGIDSVCQNFETCVKQPNGSYIEEACTKENKCDVTKALPKFGALLWYKISNYIADIICGTFVNEKSRLREYENIQQVRTHFMAYISTIGWESFFREAVSKKAYGKLDVAMELVEKRKDLMKFTSVACNTLKARKMCAVVDILKQYTMLSKIKNSSPKSSGVRDIRLNANLNQKELMKLNKDAVKHDKLLSAINFVGKSLKAAVTGISKYFGTLAKFDQKIGEADVGYIAGELQKFYKKSENIQKKLQDDMAQLMKIVQSVLTIKLISEVALLASTIAENANPFKVLLTGVNAAEIFERTAAVAGATSDVATGAALIVALRELGEDTYGLAKRFRENQKQLASLQKIVDVILAGEQNKVYEHADLFIEQYGSYTPKEGRSRLVANDAKWSAYKDRACDFLQGGEAGDIEITAGRTAAGALLICEKLEGTLAEFFTLREDIYDFQFDLVDSFARVIRGNIAKKLAMSIKTADEDVLDASELMRGFFIEHYRLQSEGLVYCDILRYKNHGIKNDLCPESGFVDYGNLGRMSIVKMKFDYESRYVHLPTRPAYPGDKGFINLPSLAAGNAVTFQLPHNRTWLEENKWITCNDLIAPFVTSIKIYLPLKNYNRKDHTITRTMLTNEEGSFAAYDSGFRYILPKTKGNYATTYEQDYNSCPIGEEMKNPYGACAKLPGLCDSTKQNYEPILRPTILSTWKLAYHVSSGSRQLEWEAPNPATNLYVKVKVCLQMKSEREEKSQGCGRRHRRRRHGRTHCCTNGNQYLIRWTNQCVDCPKNSTSRLGGYYCAKDSQTSLHQIY